jgi:lipopolysaccharide export system permease protein
MELVGVLESWGLTLFRSPNPSMIPIIDRYILRETLKSFLAILSVLMLILISHAIMKLLQRIAAGRYSSEILVQMIGLESLTVLGTIAPPAFFFAILYSLGRMYRDSEMTALFAGGVGMGRIYRSYLTLAIPLSLLVALFTLYINPEVNLVKEQVKQLKMEDADLTQLPAGRFHESNGGKLTYYFERLSEEKSGLENIFVQQEQLDQLGLITARAGSQYIAPQSGDRFIILHDGRRYAGTPGEAGYSVGEFREYGLRIEREERTLMNLPSRAIPTLELLGSDHLELQAELQERFMMPLAILVFTLVSIPMSRSLPREGIYGRLVLAVLFYFLFINLMALSKDWMRSGATPLWLGRWWVHPAVLGVTWLLLSAHKLPEAWRARRRGRG